MEKEAKKNHGELSLDAVIEDMIEEQNRDEKTADIFRQIDRDGDGQLSFDEFCEAYRKLNPNISTEQLRAMFDEGEFSFAGIELWVKEPIFIQIGQVLMRNRPFLYLQPTWTATGK